jgi:hypothetical protein
MTPLRIKDDRDRRVPLHWRGLFLVDSSRSTGPRSLPWLIVRRVLSRPAVLLAVGVTAVLAAAFAASRLGPIVIAITLFSPVATVWITLTAMSLVSTGEWFAAEAGRIKSAMIAAGKCPSCDYSIVGVEPRADGATICPECAAAWNVTARAQDATPRRVVIRAMREPDSTRDLERTDLQHSGRHA